MSDIKDIEQLILAKGEEIRLLKSNKADRAQLTPHINELLSLKERYQIANGGVSYGPPPSTNSAASTTTTTETKKKETKPVEEPPAREGPSKKELNRQKKKDQKEASSKNTEEKKEEKSNSSSTPAIPAAAPSTPQIFFHSSNIPLVSNAVIAIAGANIQLTTSTQAEPHQPYLFSSQNGSISGDYSIARYISRQFSPNLISSGPWLSSQIDQWIDHCIAVNTMSSPVTLTETLPLLESHLKDKTYLVGISTSLADIAIFDLLQRGSYSSSAHSATFPAVDRWYSLISTSIPSCNSAEMKAKAGKAAKAAKAKPKKETTENDDTCPDLEGAIEGQVVTRFPPEPSGYLHIGHTKAALLNQYYAQRYKGKLIIRFDDTNPSKEKEEYAENIIRDLATLQIKGDIVTHTSDSFDICERYAISMIEAGQAYMDDTEQEKMQAERLERIPSYRRDSLPAENLLLFQDLLKGEAKAIKYCLRAKIDMNSTNGTMRDPVLYRFNDTPHHRTGTKYKAYPTYDFACPIVDSIEGVTNALRTTEYNDRDEQYHWIQDALKLRKVHILAYGKINFINTVLSKRKLTWFVDNGYVDGWNDPRFPTIQGCIRRGMQVESLKNFIISQGASRRVINMEWDKFWSENKKILEDISPRYMAVTKDTKVTLTVTNLSNEVEGVLINIHPSKPEMGQRVVRRYNKIYLEVDDAQLFVEGEEVTLVRWGNFFIDRIQKDDNGKVISLEGRHNPDATNFSKTKKATWIAAIDDLVPCQLVEFDHLISKPKLTDDDDFKDHITPVSRAETIALGDPYLRTIKVGEVIQLERKGFFRCDQSYGGGNDKPAVFFLIPDGRVKAMSTLSSALHHR